MDAIQSASVAAIGLTFTIAGVSKLRSRISFYDFVEATARISRLDSVKALHLAVFVIAIEAQLVLTLVLAFQWETLAMPTLIESVIVLTAMTLAVARAARRGELQSCKCFGAEESTSVAQHAAGNSALICIALGGAWSPTSLSEPGWVELGAGLGALFGAAVVAAPVLWDTFRLRPPRSSATTLEGEFA